MITKYYINFEGSYLGGFSEGNPFIPQDAIEIQYPPEHGWQRYDKINNVWIPLSPDQLKMINLNG